jgi:hypothetical protein
VGPRSTDRRILQIDSAFQKVRKSARKAIAGDGVAKDRSLEEIFALNNEIGRLGRETPGVMPRMRELQGCVNMITVAIKYGRKAELDEGLAVTERIIESIKRNPS